VELPSQPPEGSITPLESTERGSASRDERGPGPAAAAEPALLAADLTRSWQDFLREPWPLLAAGLVLLAAVAAVRHAGAVFASEPLPDEAVYLAAFERAVRGESPYRGEYFYLPALAVAGGALLELGGRAATLALLRICALFGAAVLVWWSLAWSGLSPSRRLAAGALFLLVAEPVRYGILWGNLSLALAASLVLALHAWPRRPLLSGLLLGAGIAVKPLAPAALIALAAHRPSPASLARARWVATGAALLIGALVVLVPPHLGEFLELAGGRPGITRNVSFHRLLHLLGWAPPALVLSGLVALAGALLVRLRPLTPMRLYCVAAPLLLLATPLVWSHTLLVTLPLQVIALRVAWQRWHARAAAAAPLALLEAILVVGAVLAIELSQGVGGIDDRAGWIQALVLAPPVAAPAALGAYVAARTAPF
jgi:hypothetical protein